VARVVAFRGGCVGGCVGGSGGSSGGGGGSSGGGILSPHPGSLFRSEERAGFHPSSLLKINKLFYNGISLFIIVRVSRLCTSKSYDKNCQKQVLL
jgi:hypothetical protein